MNFSAWSASDFAAWWAAVVATIALAWHIFNKLRSGYRIDVSVTPNIQFVPESPPYNDRKFVKIVVTNRGDSRTKINQVLGFYAPAWHHSICKKMRVHFVLRLISSPYFNSLPFDLDPGLDWVGLLEQKEIQERYEHGWLYIGIYHTQKKRPLYKRVKF